MKVSIGICAYNEGKNIGGVINNLLNQNLGKYTLNEIIVVASGCTDETISEVQYWRNRNQKVKLIVESKRNGKTSAMNKLLQKYRGDILIHVSADLFLPPKSLVVLLDHFSDPNVGAVSGKQLPHKNDTFMDHIGEFAWSLHNETLKYFNHKGSGHLGSDLWAIRRGICNFIPKEVINDDAYLGVKCIDSCYKIHFEDKIINRFQPPQTITDFIIQRRRILYGHLTNKRITGSSPSVFEMCTLKDKFSILFRWLQRKRQLLPYLIISSFIEFFTFTLVIYDLFKKNNNHKIWKIANTTKFYT